ncbi:MAG: signal peptidase II [Butyricicoccus pullicaecorum]|nr:signal peptidase II [Butyricicoccus pullicaecorum]
MILFLLVAFIVALDQLVKFWVVHVLMSGPSIVLIPGIFQLTYVENRGAAFSFLENHIAFFVIATLVVLLAIIYAFYSKLIRTRLGHLALVFVSGGAIGNFLDRIFHGYVVDMFYFELIDFPVFNVADIFIVIGGVLFAYYILIQHDKVNKKEPKHGQND